MLEEKKVNTLDQIEEGKVSPKFVLDALDKPIVYTELLPKLNGDIYSISFSGLAIIGGVPGSGKTSLGLQAAGRAAAAGKPVVVYSFEMSKAAVLERMLLQFYPVEDLAGRKSDTFLRTEKREGRLENSEPFKKLAKACEALRIFDINDFFETDKDKDGLPKFKDFSIREVKPLIEAMKANFDTKVFVLVDSLQELPASGFNSLKEKIDYSMRVLRALADSTGSNILAVSQLSRTGQKEGNLQSYLGSAGIEFITDVAFFIEKDGEDRKIKTNKNRYGKTDEETGRLAIFSGQNFTFK